MTKAGGTVDIKIDSEQMRTLERLSDVIAEHSRLLQIFMDSGKEKEQCVPVQPDDDSYGFTQLDGYTTQRKKMGCTTCGESSEHKRKPPSRWICTQCGY